MSLRCSIRKMVAMDSVCRQLLTSTKARCHEAHALTGYARPARTEPALEQIATAILKVIRAYEK
jgi:hypothetical protein